MAQTVTNVSAAKPRTGGAVYIADTSVTLPTDATSTLGTGFTALGYISEDGLVNSNTPNTETINAWGGDPVLTLYNAKEDTFQFQLLEVLNEDVLKAAYGSANVTGSLATGITVKANNKELDAKAFVFDMIMREGALKRIVIPIASVSALGDVTYSDSGAVGYDITLSAQTDSNGNTHYEYISKVTGATGATGANG